MPPDFAEVGTPICELSNLSFSLSVISRDLDLDAYESDPEFEKIKNIIRLNSWYRSDQVLVYQVAVLFLHWLRTTNDYSDFLNVVKSHLKDLNNMKRRFPVQMGLLYLEYSKINNK